MVDKNDWRLRNQLDYLYGVELFQVDYQQKSSEWEHEHCEFCWDKFSNEIQKCYTTKDKYHWICTQCYNDFKEMFKWK